MIVNPIYGTDEANETVSAYLRDSGPLLFLFEAVSILTACLLWNVMKCYDYMHPNCGSWITHALYNNTQALAIFFLAYNVSIDGQNVFTMQKSSKLKGERETLAPMLHMGHQQLCIHKDTSLNAQ